MCKAAEWCPACARRSHYASCHDHVTAREACEISQCLYWIQIIKQVESRQTRSQARVEPLAIGWRQLFLIVKFAVRRNPILQTGELRPRG